MATLATQTQINNTILSQSAAGVPTTAIIDLINTNEYKKEIVYKELDKIAVEIIDRDNLSRNYLRLTYLPDEFRLGKNLIKIRPNVGVFEQNTYLYVEVIDYNGEPIYYEVELNSDSDDNFIIISVYIYEDTCPGPCAVYIAGTLKDYDVPDDGRQFPVNFRWEQIINIDTTERTTSPIIYTVPPSVTLISNTSSYSVLGFSGGTPYTSSNYTNLYLYNGFLNPSITPLNKLDIFKPSMGSGELRGNFSDIVLKSPSGLKTYPLTNGFTASITTFVNEKSMQLKDPIVIYQYRAEPIVIESATINKAYINFEQSESIVTQRNFKKRVLTVQFDNLDPFVGQVRTIKTSIRDTALKNTEYLLLSDFEVPSSKVNKGFNPVSIQCSIVLPDSYQDQYYDIKFEFYNNETIPSSETAELFGILVPAAPPVDVEINNEDGTIDAVNLVRTLWQDFDTRCVHTSSTLISSGDIAVSKSIAQFTAFIPEGAPYITTYYNAAFINLVQKTGADRGLYSYNTILSAYEMDTSSYADFAFDVDRPLNPPVYTSQASIIMDSGYPTNQTAYGYPIKHIAKLPVLNKLYRFTLDHNLSVPYSSSTSGIVFDAFNNSANWDTSYLPGQSIIGSGTASISLNPGMYGYIYETLSPALIAGEKYKISFDITQYNAPGFTDYVGMGISIGGILPNISVASNESSGKIYGAGTYEYILNPPGNYDTLLLYFNTSAGSGNPILNSYKINSNYLYNDYPDPLLEETLGNITYSTVTNTDPKISLADSSKFNANTDGVYTFNCNFTLTGSCASAQNILPTFIKYNSSDIELSRVYLPIFSINPPFTYQLYTDNIKFSMSSGDYIKLQLISPNGNGFDPVQLDINGSVSYVDITPTTNASTFKIQNIQLSRLLPIQASFEASCSIKDIDIVSSGYKFISASRPTKVTNAYGYYTPVS